MHSTGLAAAGQIRSLQVVRAIAAASVVYFHTSHQPNFGTFGVDLFFVLSGFVIAMVVESRPSPWRFLIDRLTRIAPLYWLLTTLLLIVAAVRPSLLQATTFNLGNYAKSLLFIPYFKENGVMHPMLPVGWTLNYEMLFYLAATVAILIAANHIRLLASFLVLAAAALGTFSAPGSIAAEFLGSTLLFEFLLGMLAWHARNAAVLRRLAGIPALLVASLLIAGMAWIEGYRFHARGVAQGIPAFFVVLIAYHSEPFFERVHGRIASLLVHLGDASYATYLTHLYVIESARRIVAATFPAFAPTTALGMTISIMAALAVGSATYLLLDRPSVRLARRLVAVAASRGGRKARAV